MSFEILMPKLTALISNGIIPVVILLLFMAVYYRFFLKRIGLTKSRLVQVVFVFIVVAFIRET